MSLAQKKQHIQEYIQVRRMISSLPLHQLAHRYTQSLETSKVASQDLSQSIVEWSAFVSLCKEDWQKVAQSHNLGSWTKVIVMQMANVKAFEKRLAEFVLSLIVFRLHCC